MSRSQFLFSAPILSLALIGGIHLAAPAFNISAGLTRNCSTGEIIDHSTLSELLLDDQKLKDKERILICQFVARDEAKSKKLCEAGDRELKKGDFDKAKDFYMEANLFNSTSVEVMLGLAKVADKQGDLDEAIKRARAAAQFDPDGINTHMILAGYLERNQDEVAAALQYERTIDLTKDKDAQIPLCNRVASLLIDADEFERADALTKQWVGKHPKSADIHYDRGLLLAHSTKPAKQKEAVKELDKALALEPHLNIAHYQLGLVLAKLDDKERAESELNTYIKNQPGEDKVKLAREAIEKLKAK